MSNKQTKEIYIVIAYRWGERDNHSYTLGAFTKKAQAISVAYSHSAYRGGKYACVVEECIVNRFDNDEDDYTKEIFRAKAINEEI